MEILATDVFYEMGGLGFLAAIVGGLMLIGGIIALLVGFGEDETSMWLFGALVGVVGAALIILLHDVDQTQYIEHKVIVEDFNEVYRQGYDIIEQDGRVTTIRKEKGDE